MDATDGPFAAAFAIMALVGGLWLLARGFGGYRTAGRISGTATSTISALAVGEVRVSGVIEPAELTIVSLLQSAPCVAYRSCVDVDGKPLGEGEVLEERSVGFRVRDPSGSLRIFPRGARIDAPVRWSDSTDALGQEPPGLYWRTGSVFAMADPDREAAIAALVTVRDQDGPAALASLGGDRGHRDYRESRLAPGDEVTIVGVAVPFGDLADPSGADVGGRDPSSAAADPEVAADLARARAAGILLDDPEAAWGNAAIPGFGIGRPTREPDLDPAANALPIASAAEASHAERMFAIAPETLVVAATGDAPLLITYGAPAVAAVRHGSRFLVGLLGAVVSIGAAVVLAMLATNGLGS